MANVDEMLEIAASRRDRLAATASDARPRRRLAILACMDARIDPAAMFGLAPGEAHVVRNAGGLVTDDAIRSLSTSQRLLGTTEIVVVMHEGCGLQKASDADFAAELAKDGVVPSWNLGAFGDVDAALREGLARLRRDPSLPSRESIRGFVFDPDEGTLREVD
jgi:carbonic anhydrase